MHRQPILQDFIRRSQKRKKYLQSMITYYKILLVCILISSLFLIILPQLYFFTINKPGKSTLSYISSFVSFKTGMALKKIPTNGETANKGSYETFNEQMGMGCIFPTQNPYDAAILPFIKDNITINCQSSYPMLFASNETNFLLQVQNPADYGFSICCYRNIIRFRGSDNHVGVTKKCTQILEQATKISSSWEFIAISCKEAKTEEFKFVDIIGFAPLKQEVKLNSSIKRKKLQRKHLAKSIKSEDKMNVVILGLDSVSHMNFIRTMPKAHDFVKQNLSAIGMNGYTKIGDNTYPNAIAFMTGMNETEFSKCLDNNSKVFFDNCPFIWKNYSAEGYATSLAEDAPFMSIFNHQKSGFNNTPVDYYLRPLTLFQEMTIGTNKYLNANLCYGPRIGFEVIVDYLKKLAFTMQTNYQNYIQFAWATSLFHDHLNSAKYGDSSLTELLSWFQTSGYFNNTVFILMSDHGMRWGKILRTTQGRIEERMPFLYFVLPSWFQNKYSKAVENLRINSNRLSTPFDLYETIKDILHLDLISNNIMVERTESVIASDPLPRGISLFLPIPKSRTCDDAAISVHYCVCNLKRENVPVSRPDIQAAGHYVVDVIRESLKPFKDCETLTLMAVFLAEIETIFTSTQRREQEGLYENKPSLLTLGFQTMPGNATFEATLQSTNTTESQIPWVVGGITRTNLYGNQSACVSDSLIKKFCYCKVS